MIQFGTIKYGIQFRASAKEKVRHQRGESSGSCSEEDGGLSLEDRMDRTETHMCPRCHEQFQRLHEFIHHKRMCDEKALQMGEDRMHSDPEDMVVSGDEEMDEPGKRLDEVQRHRQDAENNNSLEEEETEPAEGEIPAVGFPFPAASHVTLEALQNTKVAVAQFAATALANDPDNEAARQELEVLQSTLFTLQHQQVFQLQLIQQLQNQLLLTRRKEASSVSPPPSEAKAPTPTLRPTQSPSPSKLQPPQREPTPARRESPSVPPTSQSIPPTHSHVSKMSIQEPLSIPKPLVPSPPIMTHPPYSSISSSLASTIITNNDPPPSLNEPNTLEMLQKRAQEVLDNASQGLLANNLADELAFRKSGKMSPYDGKSGGRNEPFFKHRCRYCGKVFGSDSALQIHIRSHTGERPFKCNVCGSRFTTKGNLKVHFQRHTAKFPHVKMNPNPIPEHLDKYHPPILAQMSPGPISGMPPHPMQFPTSGPSPFPPGLPMYRPPHHDLMPPRPLSDKPIPHHALFALREEQDRPADLSKPTPPSPLRPAQENRFKTEPHDDDNQRESIFDDNERLTPKHEPEDPEGPDGEQDQERYPSPSPYDDCSTDSKYSNEDMLGRESPHVKHDPDQPENLSSKNSSITGPITYPMGQRIPPSPFFFPSLSSPPSSTSSGSMPLFHPGLPGYLDVDPTRDPTLFNSLLPRPGSNDNSWESLIEITKTSETSKLQQLVDNIENKLTDPNQCVICQRVLSCKSALQMHYRTHTGERPFRCRICGRAFTTKGNLKTHMGVHRMKPPSQLSHQCPVCHKRFTNSLILQQHIRLHTGEPTDISPEQIQAAELRESPVSLNLQTPGITDHFLSRGFPFPGFPPPGFVHDRPTDLHIKDEEVANEEDDGDYERSSEVNENQTLPFSASLSALENQVMTITTMASQLSATGSETQAARSSPLGSPSARRPLATPPMMPATPPLLGSPLSSLAASVLGGSPFSPLGLALGPAVRGNTTCNICYKTFACNSALEIHYRSHTKERPFKCTVCDRGFSTKSSGGGCRCGRRTARLPHATALNAWNAFVFPGNMKQHMLTHKIRDMPPHGFDKSSTGEESRDDSTDEPPLHHQPHQSPHQPQQTAEVKQEHCAKRSPPNIDMPLPKRPSVGAAGATPSAPPAPPPSNKHLCGVCRKNFSSSSALQIHMRTHTGDKPFRCAVCQKAFTTKGNLKVHMGTHMWSSGASRRGRRMSLELPPRPALEPHELLRRPDLFYPYLPAPFLNGMQQKLNEISVIQQNAGQNGMGSPGAKFPGLLGFGSFPPPPQHSQPGSPLGDGAPPSLSGSPPRHASPRELAEREALLRELAERDRDALLRELAARARDPADHEAALREMAGRAALERDRELALAAAEKPQEPTDKDLLPRMWDLHYERKAAAAADASGERLSPGGALALIPPSGRTEGLTV